MMHLSKAAKDGNGKTNLEAAALGRVWSAVLFFQMLKQQMSDHQKLIEGSSPMGAVLALTESLGLGMFGIDHLIMYFEAKAQNLPLVATQHLSFAFMKAALLVGGIVLYFVLHKIAKVPARDPLFVLPLILLLIWLIWTLHDLLWVIMGSLLDYKYILNVNTKRWKPYSSFTKFVVLVLLLLVLIVSWHFVWYLKGQR